MSSNRPPKVYESPLNSLNNCDDIDFRATLQKPNESALRGISEGDILSVNVNLSPLSIEVTNSKKEVCGIVTSSDIDQLIDCIEKGFKYHAIVIGVMNNTVCVVRILSSSK